MKRNMDLLRRRKVLLWGTLLATGVGLLGAYWSLVRPWRQPPPEPPERVEALWEQVQRFAVPNADPLAPADLPPIAEGKLRQVAQLVRPEGGVVPTLPPSVLSADAVGLLDSLVIWSRGKPSPLAPSDRCEVSENVSVLPYLTLGRLALARAEPSVDDPYLVAALRLGRVLRRRGNLTTFVGGLALASDAAAWSKARGVPPGEEMRRLAPTRQELLSALARGSVCIERLVGEEVQPYPGVLGLFWIDGHVVDLSREIQMLRWCSGRQFDEIVGHQDDFAGFVASHKFDPEELPKSFLCRLTAMDVWPMLRKADHQIKDYSRNIPPTP